MVVLLTVVNGIKNNLDHSHSREGIHVAENVLSRYHEAHGTDAIGGYASTSSPSLSLNPSPGIIPSHELTSVCYTCLGQKKIQPDELLDYVGAVLEALTKGEVPPPRPKGKEEGI